MFVANFNHHRRFVFVLLLVSLIIGSCGKPQSIATGAANASLLTIGAKIDPPIDIPANSVTGVQTVVLAGGCFWGVEAVFQQLQGISSVVSGFSGGSAASANYDSVSRGTTDHAEAVQITYDPQQISFGQLLKIYFVVAHDPTQVNRQSPDEGTQYRSAIFYANSQQQRVAKTYIDRFNKSGIFTQPIATQLVPLAKFYPAEEYHQNFIDRNPNYPYVVIHDLPKLDRLKQHFPDLVRR